MSYRLSRASKSGEVEGDNSREDDMNVENETKKEKVVRNVQIVV